MTIIIIRVSKVRFKALIGKRMISIKSAMINRYIEYLIMNRVIGS